MGREANFKGNTKATQFPHNDPTKGGRKPSIKTELKKIALSDGIIKFAAKDVTVHEDGSVSLKLPKQDALAMKLWQWAMSKKGNDSIKAIQMIMEQFDGKATQPISGDIKVKEEASYDKLTPKEKATLLKLKNKAAGDQ